MTRHPNLLYFLVLTWVSLISIATNSHAQNVSVEPGVSLSLATQRKALLADINYRLHLEIPADQRQAIVGSVRVEFDLADAGAPLQLDFREAAQRLTLVVVNGNVSAYRFEQEHLIIPAQELVAGRNSIVIELQIGDSSLNRNPEFLYTLFVPDRARTAFPLFDQPDLKATWELTLVIPEHWQAIANAPLIETRDLGDRKALEFARSDLISSYLFSFVAGEFDRVTRDIDGRHISLLHRESDADKVARNIDAAFELHAAALNFLESYTGINYPFQKFDFALIPGFQYGGMEHVGAIQYRADSIFLDESPSQNQLLSRASLIAHETAHMWFGDLVTMEWFNDVWMKEVFANFMAAKAVNPSFPEINHELGFLVRHYPSAYAVDRTEGANPIRQDLDNLNEAGTLYGNIIYNKAPVMMRQLEALLGEQAFRDGLREYLSRYADGNATWPDLIAILDSRTEEDLHQWSEVWVNTAGRPHFTVQEPDDGSGLIISQQDPAATGRIWPQRFDIATRAGQASTTETVYSLARQTPVTIQPEQNLLLNSDGYGYGLFPATLDALGQWQQLGEVEQGVLLISLYDNLLEANDVPPQDYAQSLLNVAAAEDNQLVLNLALGQLQSVYWSFLTTAQRQALMPLLEDALWSAVQTNEDSSIKKLYFDAFYNTALSPNALNRVLEIWRGTTVIEGLNLSESDSIDLASDLAIKLPDQADQITATQLDRIENADRRRRFAFVTPALSSDQQTRDEFFGSLSQPDNRAREPWVLDGLRALHHPLRTGSSEKYLLPSLERLQEIQQTGDIFFPARWLSASLGNYRSDSAVNTVRHFLAERPDYNRQLRLKILQAADPLFRAQQITRP
jgi:aminopeptidase N